MVTSCYHRISDKTVASVYTQLKQIFSNLTVVDMEWNDSYNNILKVDYAKYRSNNPDLELTPEQQLLFTKLQVINN